MANRPGCGMADGVVNVSGLLKPPFWGRVEIVTLAGASASAFVMAADGEKRRETESNARGQGTDMFGNRTTKASCSRVQWDAAVQRFVRRCIDARDLVRISQGSPEGTTPRKRM